MYEVILIEKRRKLADQRYTSKLLEAFNKCMEKHVWAVWANEELYINNTVSFEEILYKNIRNIYDLAISQGYEEWIMHKEKWKET